MTQHIDLKIRAGVWLAMCSIHVVAHLAIAVEPFAANESVADNSDVAKVLASVNGVPIQLGEVQQQLLAVKRARPAVDLDDPRLMDAALHQIIRRRCALAELVATEKAASAAEVDRELDRRREQFQREGMSFDEHLIATGVHLRSYRQRIRWELSWARYRDKVLTEEHIQEHYRKHRREFDGTQIRVSHILLKSKSPDDPENMERLTQRASTIRDRIVRGKVEFAEAARRFSDAPSAADGGDIGWLTRHGVMHDSFAKAAFQLQQDEVSPPVKTPFGVHLIKMVDGRPGEKEFAKVRDEVAKVAEQKQFDTLAGRGSKSVIVRISKPL